MEQKKLYHVLTIDEMPKLSDMLMINNDYKIVDTGTLTYYALNKKE